MKNIKITTIGWGCLLSFLLILCSAIPALAQTQNSKHVLLLNSYHQDMSWVKNITQAVQDTFNNAGQDIILHIENMDTKRHLSAPYLNKLSQLYSEKYKDVRFDLILSSDNNALDFLLKQHETLFPEVPVVFCGVNNFKLDNLQGHEEFTGVAEMFSDIDTIKTMLRLHPGTKEIFIVNDFTPTGQAWTRKLKDNISKAGFDDQLKFSYSGNVSLRKLKSQLRKLDNDVLVLLGVYFKDSEGVYKSYEEIGEQITNSTKRPIYVLLNFNITDNVVGGKVTGGTFQGQEAARIGLKVLSGVAPANISVKEKGSNHFVFNWPQLQAHNIDPDALPIDSLIINHPPSFYEQYRTFVWAITFLIGFLLLALWAQFWRSALQQKHSRELEATVAGRTSELMMQSKLLEEISHLSKTGGWELDLASMHLKWTAETYAIHDMPLDYKPTIEEAIKFYSPGSQPVITAAIEKLIEHGTPFDLELSLITARENTLWVRAIGELVYEDGEPRTVLGSFQDISEKRRSEKDLREANDRFTSVMGGLDAVVYVADMETYEILYLNDYSEKLYGKVIGKKCWQVLQKGQSGPCDFCTNDRLIAPNGKPNPPYVWEVKNTQTGKWFQCHDAAVPWNDGRLVRMEIAADITDRIQIEADLKDTSERYKYEVDVKNRLFSIISHDLKSPFNSLLGMTQLMTQMSDHMDRDKLAQYAENVHESGERVYLLLQNLLDWSQLQMEGGKLEPEVVSLSNVAHDSIDVLKPLALEKDISLTTTIKNATAYADQDMVHTIIRNLIGNAIKFTPTGGAVEISAKENEGMVQVSVNDNGTGIAEDQFDSIFDLDKKTSTTGTAGEKGTGLGLPLCKDMLERNGGRIWAESETGKGSTFHFTLPVKES